MTVIRALSWNVNGLRAVEKKGFLDWLHDESPDILCLQETKAREEQLSERLRNAEGYQVYFSSHEERKGYSGVALYTKEQPKDVRTGFGVPRFDNEGRIVIADYDAFTLFGIYFPNGQSSKERLDYKMDFYDAFLDYAEGLKSQGRNIVVCGDVNTAHTEIDLARPKQNQNTSGFLPQEREWMDKFEAHGYVDTFRMFNSEPGNYSYWDSFTRARERNVGWRIDYFFVNQEFKANVEAAFILPEVMGSDHCPVGVELKV